MIRRAPAVLLVLLALAAPTPWLHAGEPVWARYPSTPLADVLLDLARRDALDIVIADAVRGRITLEVRGEPAAAVLTGLSRAHTLVLDRVGPIHVVRPAGAGRPPVPLPVTLGEGTAGRTVSLDLARVPIDTLLGRIVRDLPLTLLVKPPAGARIHARLTRRPIGLALTAIGHAAGLVFETNGTALVVGRPASP